MGCLWLCKTESGSYLSYFLNFTNHLSVLHFVWNVSGRIFIHHRPAYHFCKLWVCDLEIFMLLLSLVVSTLCCPQTVVHQGSSVRRVSRQECRGGLSFSFYSYLESLPILKSVDCCTTLVSIYGKSLHRKF